MEKKLREEAKEKERLTKEQAREQERIEREAAKERERIEKEEKKLAKVKAKYKNVMLEISKMEKFHVDDESAYETNNNLRRRLLKDIKSREQHLKDLKRPVKAGGEEKIITFDLCLWSVAMGTRYSWPKSVIWGIWGKIPMLGLILGGEIS
mgnify:CR=1 FL=1